MEVTNLYLFLFYLKSLFNLLEFQRLVLNYSPPARVHDLPRNQKVRPLDASQSSHQHVQP